jgi:Coenzyme PQQ synthesis protein D (PqqD)
MPTKENQAILANPNIVFREEDEGAFLFDPETGDLKCLNPLGGAIWKLCDGSFSFEEIKKIISERYTDISDDVIHKDVAAFFQELLDIGYIGYEVDGSDDSE